MNPVCHPDLQVAEGIFPAAHLGAVRLLDHPDAAFLLDQQGAGHLARPDENLADYPDDSDNRLVLAPVLGQGGTAAVDPAFQVGLDAIHLAPAAVFLPALLLRVADQTAVQLVAGEVEFLGADRLAVVLPVLVLCPLERQKVLVLPVARRAVVPLAQKQVLH